MAAGLAQLRELERTNAWAQLEKLGAHFEQTVRATSAAAGKKYAFHRLGSMFCLFFTEEPVRNLDEAKKSDTAAFARFFHHCLDHGVYFAPSQFETGFISTAHTPEDIVRTAEVAAEALRQP
jgi:glutamate-1-semialdehyde 2,1-aminomutase